MFCVEAGQLFRNKDYLLLFAAFSIGVGFFNSLLTLLNQIVAPFGYRFPVFDSSPLLRHLSASATTTRVHSEQSLLFSVSLGQAA